MSAFSHGFEHGFMHGMFNNMFGGGWCNPFGNPFSVGFCNPFTPSFTPFTPFSPMFGGYCNPFTGFNTCWNSTSMYMSPGYNFNIFTPYQTSSMPMPTTWNISAPSFTTPVWQSYNYSIPSFATPSFTNPFISDTFVSTTNKTEDVTDTSKTDKTNNENRTRNTNKTYASTTKDFDKMLEFVLKAEGGYNPNDCGQAGNKGVLQSTYDSYRRQKGLSTRPVKNITNEEVKDLYYTMFYKASGADEIDDPKLALYVFDAAVNMGVSAAKDLLKKSGNDPEKFKTLRLQRYKNIATNKPEKAKYLNGWQNRVAKAEKFANNEMLA